jgi:nucleoside-diphosphate kinase
MPPPPPRQLLEYICSGPVVAMELVGPDAVAQWRELLGPTDPARARDEAPGSIRCGWVRRARAPRWSPAVPAGVAVPADDRRLHCRRLPPPRAALGSDATRNAAHGSDCPVAAARELGLFFGPGAPPAAWRAGGGGGAAGGAASLALIKPHALRQGVAGQLLEGIQVRGAPIRRARALLVGGPEGP